ncbi:MAG: protein kinase [Glaciihabitans sp.]
MNDAPDHYLAGYRVVRKLGEGGRGTIYLGVADSEDPVDRAVALKLFHPGVADADILAELDVLARVPTEHCVRLLDASTDPAGAPIAVMTRASRGSVARLLHRRGTIALGEAVTILAPLARTVAALHNEGIAHTRLGAASVHFSDDGAPQLLGFGHASVFAPSPSTVILESDAGARRDRHALAQLARLLLVGGGTRPLAGDSTGIAMDLLRWLDKVDPGASATFPEELESRLFDLSDGAPVELDLTTTPQTAALTAVATPHRVDGNFPDRAATPKPGDSRGPSSAVTERLLGPAPLAPARERLASALRSVRPGWWVTTGAVIVALVAGLVLLPGGSSAPAPRGAGSSSTIAPTSSPLQRWSDDPVAALPELMRERARCLSARSIACLDQVAQNRSAIRAADVARIETDHAGGRDGAAPSELRTGIAGPAGRDTEDGGPGDDPRSTPSAVALVGTLGDAAILTFVLNDEPASVLMIRTEAGWRLRTLSGAAFD